MKTYYRDNDGKFCTAKDFFPSAEDWSINTSDNFQTAESVLATEQASYNSSRTALALLIMGASSVRISGCGSSDFVGVYPNRYGEVTVQSHVLANNKYDGNQADRHALLADVFAEIERVISIQRTYAEKASAAFVDIP